MRKPLFSALGLVFLVQAQFFGAGQAAAGAASASQPGGPADPTLSVSPTSPTPSETIHYSGAGWGSCGTAIDITLINVTVKAEFPIATATSVNGAFSGSLGPLAAEGPYRAPGRAPL